jgi:hypothetical protein
LQHYVSVLPVLGRLQAQPPAPDNTKANQRDRAKSEATADQAKNTLPDREIMQKIRKSLTDDKSLATYAQNVNTDGDFIYDVPSASYFRNLLRQRRALPPHSVGGSSLHPWARS